LSSRDEKSLWQTAWRMRTDLLKQLRAMTGNAADAEDLVQDTLLRFLPTPTNERCARNAEAYIRTTARNVGLDWLRRRNFQYRRLMVLKGLDVAEHDASHSVNEEQEQRLMFRILLTLPARCQEVCRLRQEGLSYEEIAQRLTISEETVRKHLALALTHFERALVRLGRKP
jgi:RNA polymerase sigma-19 factor, ECF subfamily